MRTLIAILICASAACAQSVTGSLVGHVADPSEAAAPGVRVVATEVSRGTSREALTNDAGNYIISSMEPGVYRVAVEHPGFKKYVKDNVEVAINTTVRVDMRLEVGDVSQSIEVSAGAIQISTERGDLNHQVQDRQFQNLPLTPDRNYQSLLALVPGSTEPAPVGSAFGNPSGSLANFVNGQNNRGNSFQLDGTINNQTNVISQTAIVPPPEAIQVMDVSTNAYDAEHGRATGAVVNVQIKSGTNDVHGSLFGYNVNSALRARNALSLAEKPRTNLTQFGFTAGGPIRRNRTFFFGDYYGGRDRRGQTGVLDLPPAEFRAGDFTASRFLIHDPATGTTTGANRTPFANNRIPAARINPIARAIFDKLPQPNQPGLVDNYAVNGSFGQDRDGFDGKVNHKFSDMTEAFVRYSFFDAFTSDPPVFGDLGGPNTAGVATAAIGPSRIQSASANLTHVLSPTMVTEFRGGMVRVLITGESPTDPLISQKLGIPGINTGDWFARGMARMNITGYTFTGINSNIPFKIAETSANFVNNWTWQRGNHAIRWGADVRNLILNPYQASADARGQFSFTAAVTGTTGALTGDPNAVAAFLLGLPSTIERATVIQGGGYRLRQYFFFVQDRWVVSPKLTLNYGLRYEITPFAVVANAGDQSRYDMSNNTLVIAGYGPVNRRANMNTDLRNFGPRMGLAYRVAPGTVVRAGYGISYIAQGINQLSPKNYPSQLSVQVRGLNATQPAGRLADGVPTVPLVDVTPGIVPDPPATQVLNSFNPNLRRGYVQTFNFTLEQEFFGFVGSASYVGTLGTRVPGSLNMNAAGPGSAVTDRPLYKLYRRSADTTLHDFMLSSAYHALQTRVQRRLGSDGNLTASYTLSKSLDYTDAFALQNDLNIDLNRGPSTFDRKHNFVVSHVLPLPFGRNRMLAQEGPMATVLGGFFLSGVFSARTGAPVDITGTRLPANATQGSTNRPDLAAPVAILGNAGRGELWFDTSVFREPAPGTFGTTGRNILRGPGYVNYDLTLSRVFRFTERWRMEVMASAFNLTNSTHFGDPSGSFTGATFGQITSSSGERQVRFGARLQF